MEVGYVIINIVLSSGSILLTLYFTGFLKQKGKNRADIDDIGKITTIVEDIKADLQLAIKSKIDNLTDERTALMDYFQAYHLFIEKGLSINSDIVRNVEKIDKALEEINDLQLVLEIAKARLELLFQDNNVLSTCIYEASKLTQELIKNVTFHLMTFRQIAKKVEIHEKYNPPNIKDLLDECNDSMLKEYEQYGKNRIQYFKDRKDNYLKLKREIYSMLIR